MYFSSWSSVVSSELSLLLKTKSRVSCSKVSNFVSALEDAELVLSVFGSNGDAGGEVVGENC